MVRGVMHFERSMDQVVPKCHSTLNPNHPPHLTDPAFPPTPIDEIHDHYAPVDELNAVQGKPVDIGGYYRPDVAKASAAMRPSSTFNSALAAL